MFRESESVAKDRQRRHLAIAVVFVCALIGWAPPPVAAQGPPDGLPGVGPVVLEGELEVLYEDDEARGVARLKHFLRADNRRVPLHLQDGFAPDLPTGSRVRVTGHLADGTVTTTSASFTALDFSVSQTLGTQKVLVILFNFSNNPTQPYSPATIAAINDQVRSFYLENSYGQTTMTFTVAGWYTIAASNAGCDYSTWAAQAENAAASDGVVLSAFNRRVLAFPAASSCGWSGAGEVGGERSWINGSYALRTVAHEQGHNFGNHHSKATKCDATSCAQVEYGDDRDVMGQPGLLGHLNAFQKERLGWLNDGSSPLIHTVNSSGDYWIDSYEGLAGATKGLRIWNPATSGYYYVESRARVGFDANVPAGVSLRYADGVVGYEVDLDRATSAFDSTLDVSQVFTDASIGLSLETLSSGSTGAMIRVSLTGAPCTSQPPTVSLAPKAALSYTVALRNNNSSTCSASVFNLSAAVPVGWTGSFSPVSSASLVPGSSVSTTLTLVAPAGISGTFPFSVTGTDTHSGLTASATGSVVLAPAAGPLTVTAAATYTAGNGNNRSASIKVSAKAGTQPAAGAAITVVITSPRGVKATLSAIAGADGTATVKFSLKGKDPSGVYQVQATAASGAATGQAATTFNVP